MVETDFPHGDGTWPDTQLVIEKLWGHIPDDELRMMCSTNAAKLYRHPLPDVVLPLAAVPHAPPAGLRCFAPDDDDHRRARRTRRRPRAAKPSRMAAWRAHSFGPASEQPYRRRTSDWVRLVHRHRASSCSRSGTRTTRRSSSATSSPRSTGSPTSSTRSSACSTHSARCGRSRWSWSPRWWPAAGGSRATWPSAACVDVGRSPDSSARSSSRTRACRTRSTSSPASATTRSAFPAVRVGVIVAVISVASPYLTRPVRRLGQLLVLLIADRRRSTSAPRCPTACSPRSRSAGRSPRSCTSSSGRPAADPRPRRCRPRWSSSGSTPTTCTCSPTQPTTGTAMSARDDDRRAAWCACSGATKPTRS